AYAETRRSGVRLSPRGYIFKLLILNQIMTEINDIVKIVEDENIGRYAEPIEPKPQLAERITRHFINKYWPLALIALIAYPSAGFGFTYYDLKKEKSKQEIEERFQGVASKNWKNKCSELLIKPGRDLAYLLYGEGNQK
ncbi:MAG: hypothetical protein ABIE22_05290, partial [archaeon]